MVRAAAKNHQAVAVVTDPERYGFLLDELRAGAGSLSNETRRDLAGEAFAHTAGYDAAISAWFTDTDPFPEHVVLDLVKAGDLTYGENPHQRAAFYVEAGRAAPPALADRAAGRQGAVVQQPRRPERRALRGRRLPGAGLRDRQARQPVRRRGRRDARGGVRARRWRPTRCPPTAA